MGSDESTISLKPTLDFGEELSDSEYLNISADIGPKVDIFKKDEDGYYWFVARGDDMIISSGYNIGAIEVESVLLQHSEILECAVIGLPDSERGMLVCAYIVLKNRESGSNDLILSIQNWFKQNAAPYKYPRVINFVEALPKTETGKIQRFKLKN